MINTAKKLDQFFTQDKVAQYCLDEILVILKKLGYTCKNVHFLEPSAGDGAFIRAIKAKSLLNYSAFDIDAKHPYIRQIDYLRDNIIDRLPNRDGVVVIGNPPFGKRARLAINFINHSFKYTDTVAFILPLQFDKYSAQKQIHPIANLVFSQKLDENSFVFQGEEYAVRCCLQIWTLRKGLKDLRLKRPPLIHHWDFEMWQYNNTKEAEKYFNKDKYQWDFAVPRQGYKNYKIKETDPQILDRRTQWIFFKAKNKNILHNLLELDFEKLSKKNTSVPGFGKADVIQEYNIKYGQSSVNSTSIQTFQLGDPNPSLAGALPLPGI